MTEPTSLGGGEAAARRTAKYEEPIGKVNGSHRSTLQ